MKNAQQTQAEVVERVKRYLKENEKLLKKHSLVCYPVINFPRRSKIPFLAKIALRILARKGGILDTKFDDLRKR